MFLNLSSVIDTVGKKNKMEWDLYERHPEHSRVLSFDGRLPMSYITEETGSPWCTGLISHSTSLCLSFFIYEK